MSEPILLEERLQRARRAVEYLAAYDPIGPWLLAEIAPEGGGPRCAEFQPTQGDAAAQWIAERIGSKNVYHHAGRCRPGLIKKAREEDVVAMLFAIVDIDIRERPKHFEGSDADWLQDQLEWIDAALNTDRPDGVPEPTSIVATGGGFQPRWRYAEPIDVMNVEGRRLAKAISKALGEKFRERGFKADSVQSTDHLIRLPHTLNLPNAAKIKRGRVPVWAEDAGGASGRSYRLDELPEPIFGHGGPRPIDDDCGPPAIEPVEIDDIDDLTQYGASERLKRMIVEGVLVDHPKEGDDSSSAWEMDAACGLARLNVPMDLFVGVFLNDEWRIGDRCRRKARSQGAQQEYLRALHEKAQKFISEPWLRLMNEQHAVLLQEGGKARILSWEKSEIDPTREVPVLQSAADFKLRYFNRTITKRITVADPARPGSTKEITRPIRMGDAWLEHPLRRQHLGMRLLPDEEPLEDVGGYLNLWRGFAVAPAAGDWSLMRAHLREVIAAGDSAVDAYILKWAAWCVQNLDKPAEVALVCIGEKGSGKGTFFRPLRRLFGQHGLHITSNVHLTGRFNSHLRDCLFLYADEAVNAGDKDAESRLKGLITEPEVAIEGKGVNLVQARNRLKIAMTANPGWVVPVGMEYERRYAVFKVSDARVGDRAYFDALTQEMESGGLEAMLQALLAMDLGRWHPRWDIPSTAAAAEQKELGLRGFEAVMLDWLREGLIPAPRAWLTGGSARVSTVDIQQEAARSYRLQPITLNAISQLMTRLGFERTKDWDRPRGYIVPPLPEARAAWDRVMAPAEWNDAAEWHPLIAPQF